MRSISDASLGESVSLQRLRGRQDTDLSASTGRFVGSTDEFVVHKSMRKRQLVMEKLMSIRFILIGTIAIASLFANTASMAACNRGGLAASGFGKPKATALARKQLKKQMARLFKSRGWSGKGQLRSSRETVLCEVIDQYGMFGTQYSCDLTATFCTTQAKRRARVTPKTTKRRAKRKLARRTRRPVQARQQVKPRVQQTVGLNGPNIRLKLIGSSFEISGALKKYDQESYVITPPNSGDVTIPAKSFKCVSQSCPRVPTASRSQTPKS